MLAALCRLDKNIKRQEQTAERAGKMPEYKKWIDPAITERHFKEREAVSGIAFVRALFSFSSFQ